VQTVLQVPPLLSHAETSFVLCPLLH